MTAAFLAFGVGFFFLFAAKQIQPFNNKDYARISNRDYLATCCCFNAGKKYKEEGSKESNEM